MRKENNKKKKKTYDENNWIDQLEIQISVAGYVGRCSQQSDCHFVHDRC